MLTFCSPLSQDSRQEVFRWRWQEYTICRRFCWLSLGPGWCWRSQGPSWSCWISWLQGSDSSSASWQIYKCSSSGSGQGQAIVIFALRQELSLKCCVLLSVIFKVVGISPFQNSKQIYSWLGQKLKHVEKILIFQFVQNKRSKSKCTSKI